MAGTSDPFIVEFRDPYFVLISTSPPPGSVVITLFQLDGVDLTDQVSTTDDKNFLVAIDNIAEGEHELIIKAIDTLTQIIQCEIMFEVVEGAPFE